MAPSPEFANGPNGDDDGDGAPAARYGRCVRDLLALKARRQADVAAELGVSRAVLNNWLSGRRVPSPEQAIALERIIGVAPGSTTQHLGFLPPPEDHLDVSGLTSEQARLLQAAVEQWREWNRLSERRSRR